MRRNLLLLPIIALGAVLASSCSKSSNNNSGCTLGTNDGCSNGQVCQPVVGGTPMCFAPVQIEGRIFDLTTGAAVAGARVVALDPNGAPLTPAAISGADGTYVITISVARDSSGVPQGDPVTLRVDAEGYEHFAKAPRNALPIDLSTAADNGNGMLVVQNAATDVGLVPVENAGQTLGTISGTVDLSGVSDLDGGTSSSGGLLVVAEVGGTAVSTAITDPDGTFELFNIPPGAQPGAFDVTVSAYAAGVNVTPQTVNMNPGDDVTGVVLTADSTGLSTVSGSINFVAGGSCPTQVTSVILIVRSTLEELIPGNQAFVRGESPPGLRAGNVTGTFSIPNVPPGDYAVLAAFENDCWVRDPDLGQAGTGVVFVTVPGDGSPVTFTNPFKVTSSIAVVSPGATGVEMITDPTPTLTWAKYPQTNHYELYVFDAYGNVVMQNMNIMQPNGGGPVQMTYSGTPLVPGMIYQFRVVAVDQGGNYISATEDLLGAFEYAPPTADGGVDGGVDGG